MPAVVKKVSKVCERCRKTFHPRHRDDGSFTKFCSHRCYAKDMEGKPGKKRPWQSLLVGEKSLRWKGGISKMPGYRSLYSRRYVARKKGASGSYTFGEWELLKKQYGYRCPACGKEEPSIKLTADHIIPLSRGGSNFIENIQPLCRTCNSRKCAKIIKYKNGTQS